MKKRTGKLVALMATLIMVTASVGTVFAADMTPAVNGNEGEITVPRDTSSCVISVERLSSTKGETIVDAGFTGVASFASVTVTLMEKSNGEWVKATGVSPVTQYREVYDRSGIYFPCTWNLKSGKIYAIYATVEDVRNGVTYGNSYISSQF